jgi:hypothetical protein
MEVVGLQKIPTARMTRPATICRGALARIIVLDDPSIAQVRS